MAGKITVLQFPEEEWRRIAWEKHHRQCKGAKKEDIRLFGHGINLSQKTLDSLLDEKIEESHPQRPIRSQVQHSKFDMGEQEQEHHQQASFSRPFQQIRGEEKPVQKKEESSFEQTQKIVAGECTCCNTLFQLEILEKVGTIENADVELRKLQQAPISPTKEVYGTTFDSFGVDYSSKLNQESKIMYNVGSGKKPADYADKLSDVIYSTIGQTGQGYN